MNDAIDTAARAARRAYELGRLRTGAVRAVVFAAFLAVVERVVGRTAGAAWLAAFALGWTIVEWRGGALRTGGVRGLVAGAAVLVIPIEWLRPCCSPGMALGEAACCAEPWNCTVAGAVVGLLAATTLSLGSGARKLEAAIGVTCVAALVAFARCTALVAGEVAGLAIGLAAGVVAASAVRAFVSTLRARMLQ